MIREATWYWRIWWWVGYRGLFQVNWWWRGLRPTPWGKDYPNWQEIQDREMHR